MVVKRECGKFEKKFEILIKIVTTGFKMIDDILQTNSANKSIGTIAKIDDKNPKKLIIMMNGTIKKFATTE